MKIHVMITKTFEYDDSAMVALPDAEIREYVIDLAHTDPSELFDCASWNIEVEREEQETAA